MEYKTRQRYTNVTNVANVTNVTNVANVTSFANDYSCDVQMYDVPPMGEMSLEEFQEFGFDRLKGVGRYILTYRQDTRRTRRGEAYNCASSSSTTDRDNKLQKRSENVGGTQEGTERFPEI